MKKSKLSLITLTDIKKSIILEIDKVAMAMVVDLKEATPVDTGKARDGWKYDPLSKTISNEVDYITDLNQGSSRQAPKWFVEMTLLKYKK